MGRSVAYYYSLYFANGRLLVSTALPFSVVQLEIRADGVAEFTSQLHRDERLMLVKKFNLRLRQRDCQGQGRARFHTARMNGYGVGVCRRCSSLCKRRPARICAAFLRSLRLRPSRRPAWAVELPSAQVRRATHQLAACRR